jgi:CheY-like chemotaxis protein
MPKRVLLVEDYPANVLVATTLLETFGYGYDVASTGAEAVEKLCSGTYAAALMDVRLGENAMCGYEATRLVRQWESQQKRARLPIIAMTASAMQGDREKCIEAGMDDYISKPFDPEELRSKLDKIAA